MKGNNPMVSATANPVRDEILYSAIRKLGGSPTFEETVAALPQDFDLDETEYSGAIKIVALKTQPPDEPPPQVERVAPHALMIDKTPSGDPLPVEPVETIEAATEIEEAKPVENQGENPEEISSPLTQQEANDAVLAAENALGEARFALRRAQENTKAARAAVANAVTIWQTGLPVYSAERNVRDHLKQSQEARRIRVEQGGPTATARPGKSYLDRAAKYGRDNSPEGAARSRMQHGAHRGAFSRSEVAANSFQNRDPRRGPVVKLPSER
jgi:hypothetical protein